MRAFNILKHQSETRLLRSRESGNMPKAQTSGLKILGPGLWPSRSKRTFVSMVCSTGLNFNTERTSMANIFLGDWLKS